MAQELKYRIVVVGQRAAVASLKKFQRVAIGIFRVIGAVVRSAFKVAVVGGIAGLLGVISGARAAIRASAAYEQLRSRLVGVAGSAEKAARMFKELRRFASANGLDLEDLVKAKVILEGIGVTGAKALKSVAEAAEAMDGSIASVALAVSSMSTQSLRRLGVELNRTGNRFKFTFRNKAGDEITRVIHGINEAREGLTEIFSDRFGGGLAFASKTLSRQLAALSNKTKEILVQIGDQMLPTVGKGFAFVNRELDRLVGSELLKTPQGILTVLKGVGSVIVAAFQQGAVLAYDAIAAAMSNSKPARAARALMHGMPGGLAASALFRAFRGDKSVSPDFLNAALKDFRNALIPPSAGSDSDVIAGINALQKVRLLGLPTPQSRSRVNVRGGGIKMNPISGGMLSGMGQMMGDGGREWQKIGLEEMVARARGQTGKGTNPGESRNSPLYVEEVKPEGAGLL